MKLSAAIACLALTGVAIGVSTNGISFGNSVYATTPQSYSCGSLKFGMNDTNLKGAWSANGSIWAPAESYVTVVEHTTHARVFYSKGQALKFNNSSYRDGVISITFDYNIIQCTVYAAGWKGQSPVLSVNGVERTIEESATVTGNSGTTKYKPYVYFLPTETNVLTLQANERLVIGDIALRATTQVVEPSSVASSEESTTIESSEESVETSEASESSAEVTSVTIEPSDGEAVEGADYSIIKDGVTIEVAASTLTAEQIRVFKNKTITITASHLSQIEFTCTANGDAKYGPGCLTTETGYTFEASGKKGTWTGDATSVTFIASSNQCRITQIIVTK